MKVITHIERKCILSILIILSSCLGCEKNKEQQDPCLECPIDFNAIDYYPTWSPDGQWIAYCHIGSSVSKSGIYLIRPDRSENFLWEQGVLESMAWSPDGQWIFFSYSDQIWKKKINGDSLTSITSYGRNFFPVCSPKGDLVAYEQTNCTNYVCGLSILDLQDLSIISIIPYGSFPDFNPILNEIVYRKRCIDNNGTVLGDSILIYDYNLKINKLIRILKDPNYDSRFFKYNYLGTKILFISQTDEKSALPSLWEMDSDGKNLIRLLTQVYTADWSPTGEKIIYTDSRLVNGRLWIMNSDGTNKLQLTF